MDCNTRILLFPVRRNLLPNIQDGGQMTGNGDN